jgi:hypothetical protein
LWLCGEVIALSANGNPIVKWDNSWSSPQTSEIDYKKLILESEMKDKLSELEKEYEAVAGPIREKVTEAAKLLSEAANMAHMAGNDLNQMHDVISPMFGAMRNCGWRTSSLTC